MTLPLRKAYATLEFDQVVDHDCFTGFRGRVYRDVFKRALDITLVVLVAIPVMLTLAILALAIARDGASPFYRQQRVGRNGKIFYMWKLRSMVPDADGMLERYLRENPVARLEWDATQKLKDDPRVTAIGRLIRKSSLDELPQLFNVLKGDMSLVGPRPMMPDQRAMYPGLAYFALRPGVTGFWQISVRNDSNFAERATFDTSYFRELSFRTDVWVMLRTVRVVLRATGY